MKFDVAIFTAMFDNVYSGVGTYARQLVTGLKAVGIDVCVISPDCDDDPPHFIKIKKYTFDISPNNWFGNSIFYNKALDSLRNKIKIAHFINAQEMLFIRKTDKIAFIGTVHDSYSWDLQSHKLLKKYFFDWRRRFLYYYFLFSLEKKSYRKLDFVIANTDYVKGRLNDFYNVGKDKTRTIYYGAPLKKIVNHKGFIPPYFVGFIGGNFQRKGLIPLVKGIKMLRNKGIDISIKVAGWDKNQHLIEREIGVLKCTDIVKFCGYVKPEDIPDFLINTHIFAMPSLTEAFGLVYIEAMACGVPALGAIYGGTEELIKTGENGYLCNSYNPEDIAEKIEMLLDPELRKGIIKKGYETVEQFNIETSVRQTIEIYNQFG
jgi:glycosyltransferase involved in cell wall biosynthesis